MTTERLDLYAILGVAPEATQAEIGHAYRSLVRRHHPDTRATADESQGARCDAALQHVLAAYTVLRDPARRADYDQQFRRRSDPAPRRRQPAPNNYPAYAQTPIIAGPVRWHRA